MSTKRSLTYAVSIVALVVASLALGLFFRQQSISTETSAVVTRIVVEKQRHLMTLYTGDQIVRTYHVALGRGGLGPKRVQGDDRTPEGKYFIDSRNEQSGFHRALHVS